MSAQVLLLAVCARNLKIEGLIVAFPIYNPDLQVMHLQLQMLTNYAEQNGIISAALYVY